MLEEVRVIGALGSTQLPDQEQGNAGVVGHGSVVTALSVPRLPKQPKSTPLLTEWVVLTGDGQRKNSFTALHVQECHDWLVEHEFFKSRWSICLLCTLLK